MNLRAILTEPNKPSGQVYRYGMLALCIYLLGSDFFWRAHLSPRYSGERYGNTIVALMLLLNHLAYAFRWPATMTAALRVIAWTWLVFGCFYVFYLSKRLYP